MTPAEPITTAFVARAVLVFFLGSLESSGDPTEQAMSKLAKSVRFIVNSLSLFDLILSVPQRAYLAQEPQSLSLLIGVR